MFSQRCRECGTISTATFCEEETCSRKFILQPFVSRICCPLHDPALLVATVPDAVRLRKFKRALRCPKCEGNFFGIKEEVKWSTDS